MRAGEKKVDEKAGRAALGKEERRDKRQGEQEIDEKRGVSVISSQEL